MRWTRVGVLGALMGSAGCIVTTGPDVRGRDYALVDVDHDAPPVVVGGETWLADTIRFDVRENWERVEVVTLQGAGSSTDAVRRESSGWVTRVGGRIVLDFTCPDLALCLAPDTLRPSGEGLVREANAYGDSSAPRPRFTYRRIP